MGKSAKQDSSVVPFNHALSECQHIYFTSTFIGYGISHHRRHRVRNSVKITIISDNSLLNESGSLGQQGQQQQQHSSCHPTSNWHCAKITSSVRNGKSIANQFWLFTWYISCSVNNIIYHIFLLCRIAHFTKTTSERKGRNVLYTLTLIVKDRHQAAPRSLYVTEIYWFETQMTRLVVILFCWGPVLVYLH